MQRRGLANLKNHLRSVVPVFSPLCTSSTAATPSLRKASAMSAEAVASTSVDVVNKTAHPFERSNLESLLTKRFFYAPSFEIYNGVAGFYDYGPPGSALQANILAEWRKHFIIEEEMLEIESTCITLDQVLKTSGHVDKFSDYMVKDLKNGDIFRADHLVEASLEARLKGDKMARGQTDEPKELTKEEKDAAAKSKKKKVKSQAVKLEDATVAEYEKVLAQIDNYAGSDLGEIIRRYQIKAPETGNDLSEPVEFNLMFEAQIGPTGQVKGCACLLACSIFRAKRLTLEVFFLQLFAPRDRSGSLHQLRSPPRVQQRPRALRFGSDWQILPQRDLPQTGPSPRQVRSLVVQRLNAALSKT